MTPKEFKAWFEGFTEAMDGMPTEAQWKKVKDRVAQIDGTTTSYPVYVDRYWPRRSPYWQYETWLSAKGSGAVLMSSSQPREMLSCSAKADAEPPFDSHAALYAAGKADFDELSAA